MTGPVIPALPHHIALIDADNLSGKTATSFILDDFEEAFAVYAHHDADPDTRIPEITRFGLNYMNVTGTRALARFDTIILSYALSDGNSPDGATSSSRALLTKCEPKAGTRLYAIASTSDYESTRAASSFAPLEALCSEHHLSWCGGLAAGTGDMITRTANMPRMGMMRRSLSEATDKLILAVRCGTGAGTIVVPAPVPQFVYHAIAYRQSKLND